MDQLIPSLVALVEPFRDCFHPQVFVTFQALLAGWIVCLGPRTISEVWQATGWAAQRHHDTAYAVFHSAAWEWDDLGLVLATLILTHLIPGGVVWIVVDDTLQTYDPRVYAVGECVQHRRSTFGLVAPIWDQARVCAAHLAGAGHRRYVQQATATKLRHSNVDLGGARVTCSAMVSPDKGWLTLCAVIEHSDRS